MAKVKPSKKLQPYDEVIRYRLLGGTRIILPDDMDLRVKQQQINNLKAQLEHLEKAERPAEIREIEQKVDHLEGKERERALLMLQVWNTERSREWHRVQALLFGAERQMDQLNKLIELGQKAPEGEVVTETYHLREFSRKERLTADDNNTEIDNDVTPPRRDLDADQRDLDLLKAIWGGTTNTNGEEEEAGDPGDLPDTLAVILIGRMWARNSMDPALAGFLV